MDNNESVKDVFAALLEAHIRLIFSVGGQKDKDAFDVGPWCDRFDKAMARFMDGDDNPAVFFERIDDGLQKIIPLLKDYLEPRALQDFINGANPRLNNQRPLDLIAQGRVDEVIEAIRADKAGEYN